MLRFIATSLVPAVVLALSSSAGYDGYKLYEVLPATRSHCDLLLVLSQQEDVYDFFTLSKQPGHPATVMVQPDSEYRFLQLLRQQKIKFSLLNANVGQTIARDFYANRLLRSLPASYADKGRLTNERYYTHIEINNYIDDLATRYPGRVFVKLVGKSYEGREIKTITITNGDGRSNKNVIFVDGGFHAREWISPAAVLYIIDQLVEHIEQHEDLLRDTDWMILPVVNPDGYDYTHSDAKNRMWRKTRKPNTVAGITCEGTDPNRNFDFHWNEEGASQNHCADNYAGPKAFSEPETVVVRDLLHSLQGRGTMYLTIHSYGNFLLYPWSWTKELPDTWQDLDEVARAGSDAIKQSTGTVYIVGSSTNVLFIAAGSSDDYAFHVGFPISMTMELPGGGNTGFDPPPSSIDPYVKETWIGIRAMAEVVVRKYPLHSAAFL